MLETSPHTSESLTGKPNWRHVGAFLGLTFGLTWLLDLLIYLHGGLGMSGSLSVVQLAPGIVAFYVLQVVLGALFGLGPVHPSSIPVPRGSALLSL